MKNLHGKKIKYITFGCKREFDYRSGSGETSLIMHAEFLNQYDFDYWVLEIKDGKEIARYNYKYLESIEWLQESTDN